MALATGARLGSYEILSALGSGGMGEVYRARDTRLGRLVAIKILSETLAADVVFRERFEREGKAIAALSHPHICTLHDVGQQDGTAFLVMEYLEGETLADALKKGAFPVDRALRYAIEIADALDKAHRAGITHRDLKPANIMLTKAGAKLVDFGLAKAHGPATAGALSMLPTTSPHLTAQGTLLGTFQYMAPEQLEGTEADARSDIFAFGAVVYEMVTGKRAFDGKNQASLIGAILHVDPPAVTTLQPLAPGLLDRVVQKCLRKDPAERWQTARDLLDGLKWTTEGGATVAPATRAPNRWRERVAWGLAAAVTVLGALMYVALTRERTTSSAPRVVLSVNAPEGTVFAGQQSGTVPVPMFALSPDGRSLVFLAAAPGARPTLWLRPIDDATARTLPGTEDAQYPFWSPDGQRIAFFSQGRLKKLPISGGPVQVILDGVADPRGGSWGWDDTILIGNSAGAIIRTPSAAGVSAPVTRLDTSRREATHRWPVWLPDGRHFLFVARSSSTENSGVYLGSLDGAPKRLSIRAESSLAYTAPGYVLFLEGGTLFARGFDANRLELGDEAIPIAQGVGTSANGFGAFAVSGTGVLAYAGMLSRTGRPIWFDREGNQVAAIEPEGDYVDIRLSPDDTRLAASRTDPRTGLSDIWLRDLIRGDWSQFTFGPRMNAMPIWSPDGSQIIFRTTRRGGQLEFFQKSSGSAGREVPVLLQETFLAPLNPVTYYNPVNSDWSPDGQNLLFSNGGAYGTDIWLLPLKNSQKPVRLLATRSDNMHGSFSPQGDLVAYSSNESGGRFEVYVQTFPLSDWKRVVSTAGGYEPRWRADGREIYYLSLDGKLMAASVAGRSFGVPRPLFPTKLADEQVTAFRTHYASTRDGTRFLVQTRSGDPVPTSITLVLTWTAGLKK